MSDAMDTDVPRSHDCGWPDCSYSTPNRDNLFQHVAAHLEGLLPMKHKGITQRIVNVVTNNEMTMKG